MELQRAKGTRDFLPEDMILRNKIVSTLREVFELYGFSPLETPILERLDVLSAKYAGGAEILKEMYKLKDQGGRELGLRYDLTVPFSRVIAMNPQLKLPFKRYQIGEVFRDGPLKAGRYREFYQCDVDVVGSKSFSSDAELLSLTKNVFKKLKLDVVIRVNSRKVSNSLFQAANVPENLWSDVLLTVDKLEKLGEDAVEKELLGNGIERKAIEFIMKMILIKGTNDEKLKTLDKELKGKQGLEEIKELLKYESDVVFDVSLARGFVYYTGVVFEVFLKKGEIKSSVAAGGRYDKMIGEFIGRGEYPATGISFGLEVIMDALKANKTSILKTVTELYVIPIKTKEESFKIAEKLRLDGINVDIDLSEKGISKNLDYADKLGIPYVAFIGEDELKKKKLKLRNMKTGKEEYLAVEDIAKRLTKDR